MLDFIEPVEIFDRFFFFGIRKFHDVPFRKLIGVVLNRFVYPLCFDSIQRCDVAIQDNFSSTDVYYFVLNGFKFYYLIHKVLPCVFRFNRTLIPFLTEH